MTKEEIIELAKQAGFERLGHDDYDYVCYPDDIESFAKLVAKRTWVGLTLTQVKLLWEGVQEEAVKSGDSLNWVFYTHINEALKEKNT